MSTVMCSGMSAGRHSMHDLAMHEVDDAALGLDALGLAGQMHRHRHAQDLVHRHAIEVGVQQLVLDRVELVFLHEHLARPPRRRSSARSACWRPTASAECCSSAFGSTDDRLGLAAPRRRRPPESGPRGGCGRPRCLPNRLRRTASSVASITSGPRVLRSSGLESTRTTSRPTSLRECCEWPAPAGARPTAPRPCRWPRSPAAESCW